jgi:ABC-type uncharacterized transport system permease subunit
MINLNGISHIADVPLGTYMKFFTFSHLTLITHIIPYYIWFYNMTITLFIFTIYGIITLTQRILHMNHDSKTLYNKLFLPCITYIIFLK